MNRHEPEKDANQKASKNLRKRAEPKRRRQTGSDISNLSRDALEHLVHELEIKQADLEATNENLVQKMSDSKKQLHALSQRLLEAQEKERKIMGHALHDMLGGTLAMIRLSVQQAKRKHSTDAKPALEEIERMIDEAYQEVRSLSHSLRPTILDDFGFVDALVWYIERYEERTGIKVNFNHRGVDVELPSTTKTVIYRIVQESLTNIMKYAKAKVVDVSISLRNDALTIIIEDFGCGIDPEHVATNGSGITGMQDLCELIGGKIVIDSSINVGTHIACEIPCVTRLDGYGEL